MPEVPELFRGITVLDDFSSVATTQGRSLGEVPMGQISLEHAGLIGAAESSLLATTVHALHEDSMRPTGARLHGWDLRKTHEHFVPCTV